MQATSDIGAPRARGLVIGRFVGAPIVVRPGWLLATVLLAVVSAPVARAYLPWLSPAGAYLVGGAFGLLLLASVLVHELAHAWTARRRGIAVHQIVLTLVGGHTEMGGATTPGTSALVAVAGPLANVVLAALGWLGMQLTSYIVVGYIGHELTPATFGGNPAAYAAFAVLASSNAAVAVLNLLPGLPLDGGRLLEAAVWRVSGRRRTGTLVAARSGRVIAVVAALAAVVVPYLGGGRPDLVTVVWGALLGALLWTGAGPFLRSAAHEQAVAGLALLRLAVAAPTLPAAATIADLDATESSTAVLVDDDGAPVGYVEPAAAAAVPPEHRSTTSLRTVAVRLPPGVSVDGGLTGPDAVLAVAEGARVSPMLVVLDPGGSVYGLLRYLDVVTALRRDS